MSLLHHQMSPVFWSSHSKNILEKTSQKSYPCSLFPHNGKCGERSEKKPNLVSWICSPHPLDFLISDLSCHPLGSRSLIPELCSALLSVSHQLRCRPLPIPPPLQCLPPWVSRTSQTLPLLTSLFCGLLYWGLLIPLSPSVGVFQAQL